MWMHIDLGRHAGKFRVFLNDLIDDVRVQLAHGRQIRPALHWLEKRRVAIDRQVGMRQVII